MTTQKDTTTPQKNHLSPEESAKFAAKPAWQRQLLVIITEAANEGNKRLLETCKSVAPKQWIPQIDLLIGGAA